MLVKLCIALEPLVFLKYDQNRQNDSMKLLLTNVQNMETNM